MSTDTTEERAENADNRRAALAYVAEALAEAALDGIEEDCFAQAALFTAFRSLVTAYGEEACATFAARLPERIHQGEFSVVVRH